MQLKKKCEFIGLIVILGLAACGDEGVDPGPGGHLPQRSGLAEYFDDAAVADIDDDSEDDSEDDDGADSQSTVFGLSDPNFHFLAAVFLEAPFRCNKTLSKGSCDVYTCADAFEDAKVDGGAVTIESSLVSSTLTFDTGYFAFGPGPLASVGEEVVFSVQGNPATGIPATEEALVVPAPVELTSPIITSDPPPSFDSGQALEVTWTGDAVAEDAEAVFILTDEVAPTHTEIHCAWEADEGRGEIPASLMGLLQPSDGAKVQFSTDSTEVEAEDGHQDFIAITAGNTSLRPATIF